MKFALFAGAAFAACLALPASASIVTINGTDVTISYDPTNFVIGPTVGGNVVNYGTGVVSAQASGDIEATSSSVTFTITLNNANERFEGVSLFQHGSYELSGPNSSVSMAGSSISVTASQSGASTSDAIAPQSAVNQNDGVLHSWTAQGSDDLSSSQWAGVKTITVTVSDILTANAASGSSAYISAGSGGSQELADSLSTTVSTVPLPSSLGLMLSGMLVLGLYALARTPVKQAARNASLALA